MKKAGYLKLNQFSKAEIDQRKLNALKGGCTCYEFVQCGSCPCPVFYDGINIIWDNGADMFSTTGYDTNVEY